MGFNNLVTNTQNLELLEKTLGRPQFVSKSITINLSILGLNIQKINL